MNISLWKHSCPGVRKEGSLFPSLCIGRYDPRTDFCNLFSHRMRKTVCMGKRSTRSDLGGWGAPKTLPEESGSPCSDLIAHRNWDWRGLLPSYQLARTWTANGSRTLNANGRDDVSATCRKLIVNERVKLLQRLSALSGGAIPAILIRCRPECRLRKMRGSALPCNRRISVSGNSRRGSLRLRPRTPSGRGFAESSKSRCSHRET